MEAEALLAAARRSHRGEGVPANYVEAIRLYQLAKLRGSIEAQKMLALIYSRPTATGELDVAWMQQLAYLDLSGDTPRPASPAASRSLQREPSPLVDLLPPVWRERIATLPR
jgi:TPR repeat protein